MTEPLTIRMQGGRELVAKFAELIPGSEAAVKQLVAETTERTLKKIRYRTPIDTARAFRGWKIKFTRGGLEGTISSSIPYIAVLEFGGYPVRPLKWDPNGPGFVRGAGRLGGKMPGRRTTRAPGGDPKMTSNVSRQAPKGMVRITFLDTEKQLERDLKELVDRLLA